MGSKMSKSVTPRTGHATATVGNTVLAETTQWEEVEGNVYFPPESVKRDLLSGTQHSTYCPWKGNAAYYNIDVQGMCMGVEEGKKGGRLMKLGREYAGECGLVLSDAV